MVRVTIKIAGSPIGYTGRIPCIVIYNDVWYNVYFDMIETRWYSPGKYFIDPEHLNEDTLISPQFEESDE